MFEFDQSGSHLRLSFVSINKALWTQSGIYQLSHSSDLRPYIHQKSICPICTLDCLCCTSCPQEASRLGHFFEFVRLQVERVLQFCGCGVRERKNLSHS